jgi:hypothetical protein
MGLITILAFDDQETTLNAQRYYAEFNRETSATSQLDLTGIGAPRIASDYTLEQVLTILYKQAPAKDDSGRVALILTHCTPDGFIMPLVAGAGHSADSVWLKAASFAWKASDKIIQLRTNMKQPGSDFHGLYRKLRDELAELDKYQAAMAKAQKLGNPIPLTASLRPIDDVVDRSGADLWFDNWWDLMAKAVLGDRRFVESDLRRLCWLMQQVRDLKYDRVEIRGCHFAADRENLNALKGFMGASVVLGPNATTFWGSLDINLHHKKKHVGTHETRSLPVGGSDVVMLVHERIPSLSYATALWADSNFEVDAFFKAYYKLGYHYTPRAGKNSVPISGFYTGKSLNTPLNFALPMENAYRQLIVRSD